MHYLDTTVLGGLPVTIGYRIIPGDTSVGEPKRVVDEWVITAVNNRPGRTDWIHKRLTRDDDYAIQNLCLNDWSSRQ